LKYTKFFSVLQNKLYTITYKTVPCGTEESKIRRFDVMVIDHASLTPQNVYDNNGLAQSTQRALTKQAMKVTSVITALLSGFPFVVSAAPAPVIFSEIMINPTVGKDKGTWFELYNPGNETYNLTGLYLGLINYNASAPPGLLGVEFRAFLFPTGAELPPKQYYVIGNNKNRTTNGNVPVDWEYGPHLEMNETFGVVGLTTVPSVYVQGLVTVEWGIVSVAPLFTVGASWSFKNVSATVDSIGTLSNETWCTSVTNYGGPSGAKGTPNTTNTCVAPPTNPPTKQPTARPTKSLTKPPTLRPTARPTKRPTKAPTKQPVTRPPTKSPTKSPVQSTTTVRPTKIPTKEPAKGLVPTKAPTKAPVQRSKTCGLLKLRIFCPRTKCGIVGRNLGWCKK
jgi:Lamin Tail Domain